MDLNTSGLSPEECINNACRVCTVMYRKQPYCNIFTRKLAETPIMLFDALEQITRIKFSKDDGLPQMICACCESRIIDAYMLKLETEKSTKMLFALIKSSTDKRIVEQDKQPTPVTRNSLKRNTKVQNDLADGLETADIVSTKITTPYKVNRTSPTTKRRQEILQKKKNPVKKDLKAIDILTKRKNLKMIEAELNEQTVKDSVVVTETRNVLDIRRNKTPSTSIILNNTIPTSITSNLDKIELETSTSTNSFNIIQMENEPNSKSNKENVIVTQEASSLITPEKTSPNIPRNSNNEKQTKTPRKRVPYEDRKHVCDVCSKRFAGKSNLIEHLRLHANLRLFKCNQCDKSFVQSGNYVCHLRVHTKERPYQCHLCPKNYNQSSALKVHIRSHTNERNYLCDVCPKTFTNSSDLGKHKRIHDINQKYKCRHCQRPFNQKWNMNKHIATMHPMAVHQATFKSK